MTEHELIEKALMIAKHCANRELKRMNGIQEIPADLSCLIPWHEFGFSTKEDLYNLVDEIFEKDQP